MTKQFCDHARTGKTREIQLNQQTNAKFWLIELNLELSHVYWAIYDSINTGYDICLIFCLVSLLFYKFLWLIWNDILLPELFWPTVKKNVLEIEKNEIQDWRERFFKFFEITRTIYSSSERSEQFLVTDRFFDLFLEVSHI